MPKVQSLILRKVYCHFIKQALIIYTRQVYVFVWNIDYKNIFIQIFSKKFTLSVFKKETKNINLHSMKMKMSFNMDEY